MIRLLYRLTDFWAVTRSTLIPQHQKISYEGPSAKIVSQQGTCLLLCADVLYWRAYPQHQPFNPHPFFRTGRSGRSGQHVQILLAQPRLPQLHRIIEGRFRRHWLFDCRSQCSTETALQGSGKGSTGRDPGTPQSCQRAEETKSFRQQCEENQAERPQILAGTRRWLALPTPPFINCCKTIPSCRT